MRTDFQFSGAPKIKCLIVINALQIGGTAQQLLNVVPILHGKDIDITVVHYDGSQIDFLPRFIQAGIRTVCIDKNRLTRFGFVRRMISFIKAERFHLVHAWEGTANIYGRLAAILAGTPIIIGGMLSVHSFDHPIIAIMNSLLNRWTAGWIVNAPGLVTVLRSRLYGIGNHPVWVVRNGLEILDYKKYRIKDKTKFDMMRKHRYVVGAVGRLVPVKNHMMLLRAAKRVSQKSSDVEFWIIGDGEMMPHYQKWINNNGLNDIVKLLGVRNDVDIGLSRMDIFVQTSWSEGCPNTLIEALRASRPVICTECTDLFDMIHHGLNGFIVPINDDAALSTRILNILDIEENQRIRMGERSRQLFESSFIAETSAFHMKEAYLKAAAISRKFRL